MLMSFPVKKEALPCCIQGRVLEIVLFVKPVFLRLDCRSLARYRSELPVFAEQVLHKGAETAEYAVTFARVLDGHDSLAQDVAGAQVEFATSLVTEVHKCLAGEFATLDGGAVEAVLVEPLVVILCL